MLRDDHLQRGHSLAATLPSLLLCSQSTKLPSYHCNVEHFGEYEVGDLGARSGEEDGEGDCEGHRWKVMKTRPSILCVTQTSQELRMLSR